MVLKGHKNSETRTSISIVHCLQHKSCENSCVNMKKKIYIYIIKEIPVVIYKSTILILASPFPPIAKLAYRIINIIKSMFTKLRYIHICNQYTVILTAKNRLNIQAIIMYKQMHFPNIDWSFNVCQSYVLFLALFTLAYVFKVEKERTILLSCE